MELSQPFIRLPYSFDAAQLVKEIELFQPGDWMAHPNRLNGNSAVPLISHNGENNDDFSGRMLPTAHLHKGHYLQQVMASFNEVMARSRLMKLSAGAQVSPHIDFNYHWYNRVRIHIPVITNPEVIFHCGDEHIHMQAGECWIFDSWREHKVLNNSTEDRVHLVIDVAGSSRFWQTVRAVENGDLESGKLTIQHIPYVENASPEIRTELFNVAPVMSPGELEAIVRELISDFWDNADNDKQIAEHYRNLLTDLAKDWREVWHLHAFHEDGFPHYQRLLKHAMSRLHPHPRALVTSSNNIGVNPIIIQRILRSALFIEQREAVFKD